MHLCTVEGLAIFTLLPQMGDKWALTMKSAYDSPCHESIPETVLLALGSDGEALARKYGELCDLVCH